MSSWTKKTVIASAVAGGLLFVANANRNAEKPAPSLKGSYAIVTVSSNQDGLPAAIKPYAAVLEAECKKPLPLRNNWKCNILADYVLVEIAAACKEDEALKKTMLAQVRHAARELEPVVAAGERANQVRGRINAIEDQVAPKGIMPFIAFMPVEGYINASNALQRLNDFIEAVEKGEPMLSRLEADKARADAYLNNSKLQNTLAKSGPLKISASTAVLAEIHKLVTKISGQKIEWYEYESAHLEIPGTLTIESTNGKPVTLTLPVNNTGDPSVKGMEMADMLRFLAQQAVEKNAVISGTPLADDKTPRADAIRDEKQHAPMQR